jgi:Uma2 family endonuclease
MLEVDQRLLDERRRLGIDRWDEMWEGVLHMVPAPSGPHQRLSARLFLALSPLATAAGLVPHFETGLYRPGADIDYRIPDLLFAHPRLATERGVDGGAELVVEIRSPGDESYAKLDWYAGLGVAEILVVDPTTLAVELFRGTAAGATPVAADAEGRVASEVLGATLATTGQALQVAWDGGGADIRP